MSGWTAAILSTVFVINPVGVSRAAAWGDRGLPPWRASIIRIVATVTIALLTLGLLTAPILTLLDVSTPTFRLAAAVLGGLAGGKWLLTPKAPIEELLREAETTTLGLTLLILPGPVFFAMAANGDAGVVAGIVAVLVATSLVAATLLLPRLSEPLAKWLTRFSGAIALAVAIAIGLDAARTV